MFAYRCEDDSAKHVPNESSLDAVLCGIAISKVESVVDRAIVGDSAVVVYPTCWVVARTLWCRTSIGSF